MQLSAVAASGDHPIELGADLCLVRIPRDFFGMGGEQ